MSYEALHAMTLSQTIIKPAVGVVSLSFLLVFAAGAAHSQTCSVPGTHLSIEAAVDDLSCLEIDLEAETYLESVVLERTLTLRGPAGEGAQTLIEGTVDVRTEGTVVTLRDLTIQNSCTPAAFTVSSGALVDALDVDIVSDETRGCPQLLFADGFETGDTTGWSLTNP